MGTEGKVKDGVCFDLSCHTSKVQNYQNLIATDSQSIAPTSQPHQDTAPNSSISTTPSKTSSVTQNKRNTGATIDKVSKKMELYAMNALTNKANVLVSNDSNIVNVAATVSLLVEVGATNRNKIIKSCGVEIKQSSTKLTERHHYYQLLYKATEDQLTSIQTTATSFLMSKDAESSMLRSAEYNKIGLVTLIEKNASIKGDWNLDQQFLDAMPSKKAIINFLVDIKFNEEFDRINGEGSFVDLEKEKIQPFKEAVLKFEFDWKVHLPKLLAAQTYEGK